MIRVLVVDDEALILAGFEHILSAASDIKVVAAGRRRPSREDGQAVEAAKELRPGAAGFLLKNTDPVQLPVLVRNLAEDGVALSSPVSCPVTRTVVHSYLDNGPRHAAMHRIQVLTDRGRAVLILIAEGLSKLQVVSRVRAALQAERAGLLRAPDSREER